MLERNRGAETPDEFPIRMGSQEAIGPMDGAAFYMGEMGMSEFEYGQRVVCRGTHGDMLANIVELHSDCELVETQTGELKMFHKSKIVDLKEFEKGKRGKS